MEATLGTDILDTWVIAVRMALTPLISDMDIREFTVPDTQVERDIRVLMAPLLTAPAMDLHILEPTDQPVELSPELTAPPDAQRTRTGMGLQGNRSRERMGLARMVQI